MTDRFRISRDNQALYITAVATNRLPVFRTDAIRTVVCKALDQARNNGNFLLFAYVLMPDHIHLLTSQFNGASDVLRYVKGTIGHEIIKYLKENNHASSLEKLRHADWKRKHTYSVWQTETNALPIFSEALFMQKVNYIHQNPVRAELVERPIDHRWSSARIWQRCPLEDEPLEVDVKKISWRGGA